MTYHEVMEQAFNRDQSVELQGSAVIKHLDGSTYRLYNARLEEVERWLVVYSEHMHPMVFFKEDLESYKLDENALEK